MFVQAMTLGGVKTLIIVEDTNTVIYRQLNLLPMHRVISIHFYMNSETQSYL